MDSPLDWVATRKPPAPDELKAWLKIPDVGSGPDGGIASVPQCLLRAGLLHLEEALAKPGRDRQAAYHLLAADALITYSCEAASEAADVRDVLSEALGRASAGGTAGGSVA